MLVETAWNSCSGARAIIITLKMYPAAAAPSKPRMISGPALRKTCSLNMISSTAAANPVPRESENSDSSGASCRGGAVFALRANAAGTKGSLVIRFYDLDHFDGLMGKMGFVVKG